MSLVLAALLAASTVAAAPAHPPFPETIAGYVDGDGLTNICAPAADDADAATKREGCRDYVLGALDTLFLFKRVLTDGRQCAWPALTDDQLRDMVLKDVAEHPNLGGKIAAIPFNFVLSHLACRPGRDSSLTRAYVKGDTLLRWCDLSSSKAEHDRCESYLYGWYDEMSFLSALGQVKTCAPGDINAIKDEAVKQFRGVAGLRTTPGPFVLGWAMGYVPCAKP